MSDTYPHWLFDDSEIPDPHGRGQYALDFITTLKHPKSRAKGKRLTLDPWQQRIIRAIYGPCHPDGRRIVRNVVMLLPRGSRKTSIAGALACLHLFGPERVPGGEVISAAADRQQARLAYDEARGIIGKDTRLVAATRIMDYRNKIAFPKAGTSYTAISAEAGVHHGKTPAVCIIDELHSHPKRDLWDVLRTGLAKTAGSLCIVTTTAGRGQDSIAWDVIEYARKVARGDVDDPATLPVLFETPADADWRDEAVWFRANPGLKFGYPDLDSLRQLAREAEQRPGDRDAFRQLHLNCWLENSLSPFLDMAQWDACAEPIDLDSLAGLPCWIAVDMSSTTDMTAVVACFKDGDTYIIVPFLFVPGDNLRTCGERDNAPYVQWAEQGHIKGTVGNAIDPREIEACIRDLCARFDVREIAFDRAYAQAVMGPLVDDGFPVVTIQLGWVTQSPALNELERAVISGKLKHNGNPALRWNFSNVSIHTDTAGNRTMHKGKSTGRIDGAFATWMAVGRAAAGESNRSFYDDPSITVADLVW